MPQARREEEANKGSSGRDVHKKEARRTRRRSAKAAAIFIAATEVLSPAPAKASLAALKPPGVEYFLAEKTVNERPPVVSPEDIAEMMSRFGPHISVSNGDLTVTAIMLSNPMPLAPPIQETPLSAMYSSNTQRMALLKLSFETPEATEPQSILISTPTTWEVGSLKDIVSSRDSKYTFIIFEKCVVVTMGFQSVQSGQRYLAVERDGRSVNLPSNSFHFMLPEDAQGEGTLHAANDELYAFVNPQGVLRLTPIDVEGNFLRREAGALDAGAVFFFDRGLLFLLKPSEECISVFDSRLDTSPFTTDERLTGMPAITQTEMGFDATFATESGGTATYKVTVQSEGILSSFLAIPLRN